LLGEAGYEVEERPVDRPDNRAALKRLGFDSVPVVAVGGRAFPGFPRSSLERSLGLRGGRPAVDETLARLDVTLSELAALATELPELPGQLWSRQAYPLNPQRDHTLGHLAWSVYRMLELTLDAPVRGGLPWDELVDSTELRHWRRREEYASFPDVSAYALPLLAAARSWRESLAADDLDQELDTPWGRIDVAAQIGILAEHTEIKVRRLREEKAIQIDQRMTR
jgi:hypothetical protein